MSDRKRQVWRDIKPPSILRELALLLFAAVLLWFLILWATDLLSVVLGYGWEG